MKSTVQQEERVHTVTNKWEINQAFSLLWHHFLFHYFIILVHYEKGCNRWGTHAARCVVLVRQALFASYDFRPLVLRRNMHQSVSGAPPRQEPNKSVPTHSNLITAWTRDAFNYQVNNKLFSSKSSPESVWCEERGRSIFPILLCTEGVNGAIVIFRIKPTAVVLSALG